jgi:glutamate carboxypeptidase
MAQRRDETTESVARRVHTLLRARVDELVSDVAELVSLESPSYAAEALGRCAAHLSRRVSGLGVVHELDGGRAPHLVLEHGPAAPGAGVLLLCHYDTAWGAEQGSPRPVRTGDRLAGPGALDMKAGIVAAIWAIEVLSSLGVELSRRVSLSLTPDEEIGNPATRAAILDIARRHDAALVPEPALADGGLKLHRKGHARVEVDVTGRAAHAGIEPERGLNAALIAARLALQAAALADDAAATTVNVGVLRAGTRANIVPDRASLEVDVRSFDRGAIEHILRIASGWRSESVSVTAEVDREPMEPSRATLRLFELARAEAASIGIHLTAGRTGGGSEGNLASAAGTPALDGIGPRGGGAHTTDEWMSVESLVERTAILAGLVWRVASGGLRDHGR